MDIRKKQSPRDIIESLDQVILVFCGQVKAFPYIRAVEVSVYHTYAIKQALLLFTPCSPAIISNGFNVRESNII